MLDYSPCSRQGLPPMHVTMHDCELLPHSFHPYQTHFTRNSHSSFNIYQMKTGKLLNGKCVQSTPGGIVSVALSLGLPPVAVSNCHSLRSPDFPLVLLQAASQYPNVDNYSTIPGTQRCYLPASASSTWLTSLSASLLNSRGTCVYVTFLKRFADSTIDW